MRINVSVKTRKNEAKVIKKDFGKYEVWVKSAPVKGAANKEMLNVLAKYFNVKTYDLRIVRGLTTTVKVVELKM